MLKISMKVNKYFYLPLGLSIIFLIGVIFISEVKNNEEKKIRNELIVLTQTFANVLDADKFRALQLNPADKENPEYQAIKQGLLEIGKINKAFGIRWIYSMLPINNQIFFSVDSIPLDSPDYSDPGDVYVDASIEMKEAVNNAWTKGMSSMTEPYTDQWGIFVSTIVPVVDKKNNEIVSVLASDVDYHSFYEEKIKNAIKIPIFTLIASELVFSFIFFLLVYLSRDKRELLKKNIILKQYVENVPGVFYQYQLFPDGKSYVPYAGKRFKDLFNVEEEDVKKDASLMFKNIHKEDEEKIKTGIRESMDSLNEWNCEFRINLPKGVRWLMAKANPEKLTDGSCLWYGYVSDITERKEMEIEMERRADQIKQEIIEIEDANGKLKENKESILGLMSDWAKAQKTLDSENLRRDTIISSMGEGLIIIDRKYKISLINPKALDLLGYEENEVLGKDLHDVLKIIKNKRELPDENWPTEQSFITNKVITTSLEDDLSITTERQKDYIAVTFSIAPLSSKLEKDESKEGVVIIVRDANKDRELDRTKSGFISIASHQLRTPLTSVRWYSEMLLSGGYGQLSEPQKDLAREIHDGANRLYQTINVLLGISRIEGGKTGKERVPIDLTKITAEVIKELSPSMIEKKLIYFSFSAQADPIIVNLDPMTLRQVIINLFANSIQYTNNNGTIEARWLVDKKINEVIYSVRDDGVGIPKSAQSKIFSKFFRADNAILKLPDGTGLGLAFVKDIVTSWGGRVWFETEEGKGTTFFFSIPILTDK